MNYLFLHVTIFHMNKTGSCQQLFVQYIRAVPLISHHLLSPIYSTWAGLFIFGKGLGHVTLPLCLNGVQLAIYPSVQVGRHAADASGSFSKLPSPAASAKPF